MYSLFIGLTLGGVPLLWRAVQPIDRTIVVSAAAAIVVMALLATGDAEQVARTAAEEVRVQRCC